MNFIGNSNLSLTMDALQHDWRVPSHCFLCKPCRETRARISRESHADAHLLGRIHAWNTGNSIVPAPVYRTRQIRIPRSTRTVTIQLPDQPSPVAPTDPTTSRTRKRRYNQPKPDEFERLVAGLAASRPVPPRYSWSAVSSQHRRHRSNAPVLPFDSPRQILPLSPRTRRYLQRPDPLSDPRMRPVCTVSKRTPTPMPGAWPSELDEEEIVGTPVRGNTAPRSPFGTGLRNAVSYLRDSSYNLCANLGNKLFRTTRRARSTSIPAPPENADEGRTSKRRRLGNEEDQPSTPNGMAGDPMQIDSPVDTPPTNPPMSQIETSPSVSPVISPNSAAAMAAARRATQQFPNGKKMGSRRVSGQVLSPPPEKQEEQPVQQTEPVTQQFWGPLPPPKYKNIREFFEHDHEICLPGLERLRLTPNDTKIDELDSQREERLRIEKEKAEKERLERLRIEEERMNQALRPLGLRRARTPLITPLSEEWEKKAQESPNNGYTEQNKWKGARHRDGVELTPRDFARLVPASSWLNDNAIQATLVHLATYVNDAAGVVPKTNTPKCVALSSQYWSNFRRDPKNNIYARGLDRNWGMKPGNFLDIDTVLIPVNENNHWTVLVIRPSRRTIAYVDSFQTAGRAHLQDVHTWMRNFLGAKYVADEWRTEHYEVPTQTNGYDCGMFVITNSIYLSLGIDPSGYSQSDMPLQRRRIAAMLLNGGFTGPFDISNL